MDRKETVTKGGRIYLTKRGSTLVVKETRSSDQAEYRCTIHYRKLPAVTYRLKLIVTETIKSVRLHDISGKQIGHQIGPLSEGTQLFLTCKAHYVGSLLSLEWLVEGDVVPASKARLKDGAAETQLNMKVEKRHAHSTLTCRLICNHTHTNGGAMASIVDKSVVILLYYVPQATLLVEDSSSNFVKIQPEGSQGGARVEVREHRKIRFTCAVRARPPAYNITWLLNGRVISGQAHRRVIGESFLEVYPVRSSDAGVYACLASNTEGDGHSNAIMVSVTHPPYCVGTLHRKVVVARHSTVALSCAVEANPPNVTFTWRVDRRVRRKTLSQDREGDLTPEEKRSSLEYVPRLIDLDPRNNVTRDYPSLETRATYMAYGPSLPHSVDPEVPTRSLLKVTPNEEAMEIVCFAKNRIGRMRVPCFYSLIVIDPPSPLRLCRILNVESTILEVVCSESPQGTEPHKQFLPGPSYVRSAKVRTLSTIEVWAKGSLVANITDSHPRWVVRGLPPDTGLRLLLYNASSYTQSESVVLYTRTKPRNLATTQAILNENEQEQLPEADPHPEEMVIGVGELTWIMGVVAGVVGFLLVVAALCDAIILSARRRRKRVSSKDSELEHSVATSEEAGNENVWENAILFHVKESHVEQTELAEGVRNSNVDDFQLLQTEMSSQVESFPDRPYQRTTPLSYEEQEKGVT